MAALASIPSARVIIAIREKTGFFEKHSNAVADVEASCANQSSLGTWYHVRCRLQAEFALRSSAVGTGAGNVSVAGP